ncbi:MAG: rod shape-determining protein MreD [Paracoccaceae bacterium]
MITPQTSSLWLHRLLFVALAAVLLFLHLLPLDATPSRFPGPDLLLCLAFAWVQRRPDYLPPLLLAGVFLMTDILLMRPPGLFTALVVLGAEFLRSRHQGSVELPFPAEWLFTSVAVAGVNLGYVLVLGITAAPHAAWSMAAVQTVMTIIFYPLVVLLVRLSFNLRRLTPGEFDPSGARR